MVQKKDTIMVMNAEKIAAVTQFKPEEVAIIKATVAKGTTDTELAYFLNVAKHVGLSPFNKEIWCYKDHKENLIVFAGRDGFLKKAQESPNWNGMTSSEVCENDDFEVDIASGTFKHVTNFKNRGRMLGAYAIIKPKGCEQPTFEWAEMSIYNKGYNVWKSDPASMIKKVAESHALKKAFGITGLQSEHDFDFNGGKATPVNDKDQLFNDLKLELADLLEHCQDEGLKAAIIKEYNEFEDEETLTSEIVKQMISRFQS